MVPRKTRVTAWMATFAAVWPPWTKATTAAIARTIRTLRTVVFIGSTSGYRGVRVARRQWPTIGLRDLHHRLRGEPVADTEVGVDVAPPRRDELELGPQLAHEHVDRAVAAGHGVAPHALVDVLALEHAPVGGGQLTEQLELLARERCALLADVGVVAIGPDGE